MPVLAVMRGDPCSRSREFESQFWILMNCFEICGHRRTVVIHISHHPAALGLNTKSIIVS